MLLVHIENGWCAPFVDSEVNEPTPPAGVLHSANKSPSQHTANCYQIFKKNEHRSFPTSQLPNYWPKRDVNHSPENVAFYLAKRLIIESTRIVPYEQNTISSFSGGAKRGTQRCISNWFCLSPNSTCQICIVWSTNNPRIYDRLCLKILNPNFHILSGYLT